MIKKENFLSKIPSQIPKEIFESIASSENVKIERIISKGQATQKGKWYDQEKNEFVLVLKGNAVIEFDNNEKVSMNEGDYVIIPKHVKHRVTETSKDK